MTLSRGEIIKEILTSRVGIVIGKTTLSFKKNKIIYECLINGQRYFFWKNQIKKLTQKNKGHKTMKLKRGMRVSLENGKYEGIVTNIYERGVAGSETTYISAVEVTYDNGLIFKCEPMMCKPVNIELEH